MAELTDETLNELLNTAMRDRIDKLGETDSGAYGYYSERVCNGRMLHSLETRLARLIHAELPSTASFHEIGAGIGTLSMALALRGNVAWAIDKDTRRSDAARALWTAVVEADAALAGRMHVISERFPSAETRRARDGESCPVVISTNVIGTMTDDQERAMIDEFPTYHAAIVDLSRFRLKRQAGEDREALSTRIMAAGWKNCARLLAGDGYDLRLYCH